MIRIYHGFHNPLAIFSYSFCFQFCLAVRYFATGSIYMVIADTQGVTKPTVCQAVKAVSNYLYYIARHHIRLPTVINVITVLFFQNNRVLTF